MKALGISAMIVAIVMIFLPFGGFATALASILAVFAWGEGRTFGAVAIIIGLINTIFLSPAVWLSEAGANADDQLGPGVFMILLHIGCGVALWMLDKNKARQKQSVES